MAKKIRGHIVAGHIHDFADDEKDGGRKYRPVGPFQSKFQSVFELRPGWFQEGPSTILTKIQV